MRTRHKGDPDPVHGLDVDDPDDVLYSLKVRRCTPALDLLTRVEARAKVRTPSHTPIEG